MVAMFKNIRPSMLPVLTSDANDYGIDSYDSLCEFAARTCYKSESMMGEAPNFIQKCVANKHLDVFEHVNISISVETDFDSIEMIGFYVRQNWPYCNVYFPPSGKVMVMCASLRVWREIAIKHKEFVTVLAMYAPKTFADIGSAEPLGIPVPLKITTSRMSNILGQEIVLLSMLDPEYPPLGDQPRNFFNKVDYWDDFGSVTFLVYGVSRTLTHQLVRHRLASFSQQSQRYVDMEKGKWLPVMPPDMEMYMGDSEAQTIFQNAWGVLESGYARLRKIGIRKEDARYLLPNAAETQLVVTMNTRCFKNFLWQRALDKAAQWEIRGLAQTMLRLIVMYGGQPFEDALRLEYGTLETMDSKYILG